MNEITSLFYVNLVVTKALKSVQNSCIFMKNDKHLTGFKYEIDTKMTF